MRMREHIVTEIPHLRRFARSLTRSRDEADDLVQAVLERALSRLHLLRQSESLRPWLFRMAYRVHLNERSRWERQVSTDSDDPVFRSCSTAASQHDRLEALALVEAMERLPPEQRAALVLVAVEDATYREAADILEIPIGTLMSRLHRARVLLRELTEAAPGPSRRRPEPLRRVK